MKKIMALILCCMILTSSYPNSITNAESIRGMSEVAAVDNKAVPAVGTAGNIIEPTDKALESAIKAVKAKITIPAAYTEFNYNFYGTSSYASSYWSFNWSNPKNGDYLQVNCDPKNHITYYGIYNYSEQEKGIPKYLKKELIEKAEEFIHHISPEVRGKYEYVNSNFEGIYSSNYVYNFRRKESSIIFPDNWITVSINGITGEVKAATFHWLYDGVVPSSKVNISKEEATKIIQSNMKMQLVYRTNYNYYYKGIDTTAKKAFLVYEPTQSYISVDAKTGKVYLGRSEWIDQRTTESTKEESTSDSAAMGNGGSISLTEAELEKVKDLNKLISKEKAIETILSNKNLYLDKTAVQSTANLYKATGSKGEDTYIWQVTLRDPRPVDYSKETDYYRAYADAQVDAKTGKIISFNASLKSNFDHKTGKWKTVKILYDKAAGLKILETFIKNQILDRYNNSKLVDEVDSYVAYYKGETPVYGGYSYQFQRVNEGILYPYNGIYGSVDGVTGKIYSYGSNWDYNIEFESPKGAISPEKAFEYYISKEGYNLLYEVNEVNVYNSNTAIEDYKNAYTLNHEIRLVYRPDIYPNYISPFTGEQLNSNGEVFVKEEPYGYIDILETEENRDILLLSDMNIGFKGKYFNKHLNITYDEFVELLSKIGYNYNNNTKQNTNKNITREEIAYLLIKELGLEKVASLEGIYSTGYSDQSNINPKYLGAVALAKGLGLMEADKSNYFYPQSNVTRGSVVSIIMKFINVRKNNLY